MPLVVLACGSMSTSNTLRPAAARYVARLIAVVVLPTPAFWFVMAYTFDTAYFRTFHPGLRWTMLADSCALVKNSVAFNCPIYAIVTNARLISNCHPRLCSYRCAKETIRIRVLVSQLRSPSDTTPGKNSQALAWQFSPLEHMYRARRYSHRHQRTNANSGVMYLAHAHREVQPLPRFQLHGDAVERALWLVAYHCPWNKRHRLCLFVDAFHALLAREDTYFISANAKL